MSATIFAGPYVKTLRAGLNLFNNATIYSGNIDPTSTGFTANVGDIYISTSTGQIYSKFAGANTNWTALVPSTQKGVANGIATLDGGGHIPLSQLPSSIVEYKGTWDASTNTPTLANGVGTSGWFYIVSTAGTVDFGAGPITFSAGDWVLYNGTIWERADNFTGYANNTLSNLASPTAINQDLIFDEGAAATIQTKNDAGTTTQDLNVTSGNAGSGFNSGNTILTTGTGNGSGTVEITTGNANVGSSGGVALTTGIGAASSGQITLLTGPGAGGDSGLISLATGDGQPGFNSGPININSGASGSSAASGTLSISSGTATGGASGDIVVSTGVSDSGTGNIELITNSPSTANTSSGEIDTATGAVTGTGNSGFVNINTGAAVDGSSGDIHLNIGPVSGIGTRGKIRFQDGSEGTAGQVWTSTDTAGNGHWAPGAAAALPKASYSNTTGPTIDNSGPQIKFPTVAFDTSSSYNTSTGVYTIPSDGYYFVQLAFSTANTAWNQGNVLLGYIQQNGSIGRSISIMTESAPATGTYYRAQSGSTILHCITGDAITFAIISDLSTTLLTNANTNYFSISKLS